MEHDEQWAELNIAESPLVAAPETLVLVSHIFYDVPLRSSYPV